MKNLRKILLMTSVFVLNSLASFAQQIEMADGLRSNGKIYVVVVVAAIVSSIILTYMITIDRKISKLEKRVNEQNKN
jgi:ABC-type transport system involved in cytochrome c biogenesis permease subunit